MLQHFLINRNIYLIMLLNLISFHYLYIQIIGDLFKFPLIFQILPQIYNLNKNYFQFIKSLQYLKKICKRNLKTF